MAAPMLGLKLRTATLADLDDLVTIACAAFPADPQWDYRFPYREEYPEDHFKCTKDYYESTLKEDGVVVNIITTEVKGGDEDKQKPVALAVWEFRYEKPNDSRTTVSCDNRRDVDPKRIKAYYDAGAEARKKYFDNVYGNFRIHLRLLATHPDWQRRGAGTQHCKWGMGLAREQKIPITLFSSPVGREVYSRLGFKTVGDFTVQIEDEEEKLFIGVMTRNHDDDNDERGA